MYSQDVDGLGITTDGDGSLGTRKVDVGDGYAVSCGAGGASVLVILLDSVGQLYKEQ